MVLFFKFRLNVLNSSHICRADQNQYTHKLVIHTNYSTHFRFRFGSLNSAVRESEINSRDYSWLYTKDTHRQLRCPSAILRRPTTAKIIQMLSAFYICCPVFVKYLIYLSCFVCVDCADGFLRNGFVFLCLIVRILINPTSGTVAEWRELRYQSSLLKTWVFGAQGINGKIAPFRRTEFGVTF